MTSETTTGEPKRFCPDCGAENRADARFCHGCGATLAPRAVADAPVTPVNPAPRVAPQSPTSIQSPPVEPAASSAGGPSLVSGVRKPNVLIPAVIVAAVVLIGLGLVLFGGDLFAPTVKTYATRDAQVMSAIDPAKATQIGTVHRGDALSGHWIKGHDGKPRWLKVNWPGHGDGFVWTRDLSSRPRPDLTASGQSSQPAVTAALVYAEPDKTSPVVDDLAPGETASTVGVTGDGWSELTLANGGVGYVQAAAFAPGAGGMELSPTLANISHIRCAFAPEQSVNAPSDTQALNFYFDENRLCINHTFAYMRDPAGGLRRVMLNDRTRRVSLLQFSADHHVFLRTDYDLPPDDYAKMSAASAALKSITCPPPGDADALTRVRATLASATPDLDGQAASASWKRRAWLCTAN